MTRNFNNPFGWDWFSKDEEILDPVTEEYWDFSNTNWSLNIDPFEDFKKTARLFEKIKGVTIKLSFMKDELNKEGTGNTDKLSRYGHNHNQITGLKDEYYINVNPSDETYLTNYAKLEHNLSHIVYDTPLREARHEAHRLSLGDSIPEQFKDIKYALSADCNLCEDVIRHVFDILEDERVNSLWTDIYIGTANDYDACKLKVKSELKGEPQNPLEALWFAQNGLVNNKMGEVAMKFIEAVRGTDYPAAVQLQKDYFQNVFLPWLMQQDLPDEKQPPSPKPGPSPGPKPGEGQPGKLPPGQEQSPCSGMPPGLFKSIAETIQEVREQHNSFPDHRGMINELNKKKTKKLEKMKKDGGLCGADGLPKGEFNYDNPYGEGGSGKSYDMFDPKLIEDLKQRGSDRNEKLRKRLVKDGLIADKTQNAHNFDPEQFDIIQRYKETHDPYKIDNQAVIRLKQIWQRAKGGAREFTDDEGESIDIDAYIQEIPAAVKENIIYINERVEPGLHIVYSADCSGSMGGYPLSLLRNVTATIKKSLEFEPKIKMSMIGWGGGCKTGISVHTTMDDINNFTVSSGYGGTPESNALWYSSTWLQRQPEVCKVIFFVSDGAFSEDAAKEQVEIARSHGLNVFGIGICRQSMDQQYRNIFGPGNYSIVDRDDTGFNTLVNDIAKYVSRHISKVV